MKLIYIYGPPAVGKLTVTKELAKLTNFKIFHAHLTADYVSSVFPVR
ncbi:MAG: shikimate kinase, partial [archaeon]